METRAKHTVIITDCRDDNARMRQEVRARALLGTTVTFCGVENTLQAAGMIVDALDAACGEPIIILANVAPRNGDVRHKWSNGTPFGYTRVGTSWIFGTVDGYVFGLLQKMLGIKLEVYVFDIPDAVAHLGVDEPTARHIIETQFRSFEFLPRVAAAMVSGIKVPSKRLDDISTPPMGVWHRDNFGNAKLSVLPDEVGFRPGSTVTLQVKRPWWCFWRRGAYENVRCYARLKDVPDGTLGLVVGSSGFGYWRCLELVVQGGSAAKRYGLTIGTRIRLVPTAQWEALDADERFEWAI